MQGKRKKFSAAFKAKVALAAAKGDRTIADLASEFGVHPNQISKWKRQLLEELPEIFAHRRQQDRQDQQQLRDRLYQQIGQLKVELDWLKKNLALTLEQKRSSVEAGNERISVRRQCELLGLSRSSLYYNSSQRDMT